MLHNSFVLGCFANLIGLTEWYFETPLHLNSKNEALKLIPPANRHGNEASGQTI